MKSVPRSLYSQEDSALKHHQATRGIWDRRWDIDSDGIREERGFASIHQGERDA